MKFRHIYVETISLFTRYRQGKRIREEFTFLKVDKLVVFTAANVKYLILTYFDPNLRTFHYFGGIFMT